MMSVMSKSIRPKDLQKFNYIMKYRRHSKECMWRQPGHFYMVFNVYDSKVKRGKGEAHVALY